MTKTKRTTTGKPNLGVEAINLSPVRASTTIVQGTWLRGTELHMLLCLFGRFPEDISKRNGLACDRIINRLIDGGSLRPPARTGRSASQTAPSRTYARPTMRGRAPALRLSCGREGAALAALPF